MLEKCERETVITTSDEVQEWRIFTCQGKVMTKLRRAEIKPYKVVKDENDKIISAEYKIAFKQLSFRKLMQLTEEQKEKRRENARNARNKAK